MAALLVLLAACSSGPPERVAAATRSGTGAVDSSAGSASAGPLPADGGVPTSSGPVPTRSPAAPLPAPTTTVRPSAVPSLPGEVPVDPLSPAPPLESPPPPGRPTCSPAALTVTDADRQYTADAVQALFTVRTTGPDCQLVGDYPQVQVLGADGTVVARVQQGGFGVPAPSGAPVTLSTSTSLSFFVGTARDDGCPAAASVTVVFAGTSTALTAATSLQVCGGAVGIGPVQRLGDDE